MSSHPTGSPIHKRVLRFKIQISIRDKKNASRDRLFLLSRHIEDLAAELK